MWEDRGDLLWTWPDGEQTVTPDAAHGYFATGSPSTEGEVSIEVDGLALTASTIGPPVEDGSWIDAITSRGASDAVLRWQDPILDARIRLHMTDCTGTHGGIAAAEDKGSGGRRLEPVAGASPAREAKHGVAVGDLIEQANGQGFCSAGIMPRAHTPVRAAGRSQRTHRGGSRAVPSVTEAGAAGPLSGRWRESRT